MEVAIAGGGIGGLSLALNLHRRGISCHVYETAPEIRELGVGITLLPHAMRELTTLGVQNAIAAATAAARGGTCTKRVRPSQNTAVARNMRTPGTPKAASMRFSQSAVYQARAAASDSQR